MGGTSDRYHVSTIWIYLIYSNSLSQRGELFFSLCLMSEPTVMQWFDSFVYGYICVCISTFSVHFNIPRPVFWFKECTDFIHDNICFRTWTANNAHIYKNHIRMLVYGIFWEFFRPHSYKGWPTDLSFFGDCVLLLLETANVWGETKVMTDLMLSFFFFCAFPVFAGQNNCPVGQVQVVQGIRRKKLGFSDIYVSEMGLGTQRHLGCYFFGGFGIDSMDWSLFLVAGLSCLVSWGGFIAGETDTWVQRNREREREIQNGGAICINTV